MSCTGTDDLSTGIADIDSQHRELIARVNELVDVCSGQSEREAVSRFLVYLHEYIIYHFAAEEREMNRRGYPGFAAHKTEHEDFARRVNDLSQTFLEHGANIQVVLMTMRKPRKGSSTTSKGPTGQWRRSWSRKARDRRADGPLTSSIGLVLFLHRSAASANDRAFARYIRDRPTFGPADLLLAALCIPPDAGTSCF